MDDGGVVLTHFYPLDTGTLPERLTAFGYVDNNKRIALPADLETLKLIKARFTIDG